MRFSLQKSALGCAEKSSTCQNMDIQQNQKGNQNYNIRRCAFLHNLLITYL